jgi:hypothetical protein
MCGCLEISYLSEADTTPNIVAENICAKCGTPADTGTIFCKTCGVPLRPPVSLVTSAGATPILDSAVCPTAGRKELAGELRGVFVGICCSVALITASNHARAVRNPAQGYIVLLFFLVLPLTVVVHESGHLLAGWMVGFRLYPYNPTRHFMTVHRTSFLYWV